MKTLLILLSSLMTMAALAQLEEPIEIEPVEPVEELPEAKPIPEIVVDTADKEPPTIEQKPVVVEEPFVLDIVGNGEITKTQKAPLTPEQQAAAWTPPRVVPDPASRPQPPTPPEKTPEQVAADQAFANANDVGARLLALETAIADVLARLEQLEKP